jgi:alpha-aminoadipic semialdehyde synthase
VLIPTQVYDIPGYQLLTSYTPSVPLWKGVALEGIPNRNSLPYAAKYGLGHLEGLVDVFRGTLRYQGFSTTMEQYRKLGFLSSEPLRVRPESWRGLVSSMSTQFADRRDDHGEPVRSDDSLEREEVLHSLVLSSCNSARASHTPLNLAFRLAFPSKNNDELLPPFPHIRSQQPIDYFAYLLSKQLAYRPHERDSVLLHHKFTFEPHHGRSNSASPPSESSVTASLLHYGTDKGSAMAVTVGKTLGFASLRVLDGKVKGRGVMGPTDRDVWEGVLDSLEEVGVRVVEEWRV